MDNEKVFTMKYTKKNEDVKSILNKIKNLKDEKNKTIKKSDFVNDSIRFFYKYKDRLEEIENALKFYDKYKDKVGELESSLDFFEIDKLIEKKIEEKLKGIDFKKNKEETNLKQLENKNINNMLLEED